MKPDLELDSRTRADLSWRENLVDALAILKAQGRDPAWVFPNLVDHFSAHFERSPATTKKWIRLLVVFGYLVPIQMQQPKGRGAKRVTGHKLAEPPRKAMQLLPPDSPFRPIPVDAEFETEWHPQTYDS